MENKEIRFIDSHYNELFRIKDGEDIEVTLATGEKTIRECKYIDDYHTYIGGNGGGDYHICEFAEVMERNGNTYRPKDAPTYFLKNIIKEEFEYMFAPEDDSKNRGCICYIRGYFDNSIDENFKTTCMVENRENYQKYHTQDFSRECDNIINYFRFQAETPILKSRAKMSSIAFDTNAVRYENDKEISGYRITTKDNTYYLRCDARQGQYCLYMYCYNTNELQKYEDLKFVDNNYEKMKCEKFFKTDNGVTEVYYNPDSNAGGQLVYLDITRNDIADAANMNMTKDDFFEYIESAAQGSLVDVGTNIFYESAKSFIKHKANFEGCNQKTMNALKKYAGIEKNHSEPER